jgi:orotidine-5'-phosphate decarboxylase
VSGPFFDRLAARIDAVDSVVSVGIDPRVERTPAFLAGHDLPRWAFARRVIDATHEHAAAVKPNAAFFEDADGWRALRETVAYAHGKDLPVVVDAKRGDVGATARRYAASMADLGADAVTLSPYLGRDSVEPFLDAGLGVFVLCRTSNPGGADLQDLDLATGEPVHERVAALADLWAGTGDVGLVVGATAPDELERLREVVPDLPFLVPGVGAQGGDAEAAVRFGLADGVGLVNSSRGIIYAGEDHDDEARYFGAAGEAAKRLQRRLNAAR